MAGRREAAVGAVECGGDGEEWEEAVERRRCGKGHRAALVMETAEGGSICLVCFSNLVSDPGAPSHHVSYALSQLSRAICGGGSFLRELRAFHGHLLVMPLVQVLSSFDDEPLACQAVDLVSDLCSGGSECADSSVYPCESLARDFIARIADRLSSGALAWSRRQVYTLHCFGVLLDSQQAWNPSGCIRNKADLVLNLATGLQLPSEEIRGEILFVLYKLFALHDPQCDNGDDEDEDSLMGFRLLRLSLEVLLKTQSDDVRTNCIALLTVLIRRGYFKDCPGGITYGRRDKLEQSELVSDAPLVNLFADAIKAPLLSSDTRVQIGTLDLVFHSISMELYGTVEIGILLEENIGDYIFEILRLSGNKDSLIIPCLRVLDLLAAAEDILRQRLAVGFPTLLSVLHYVADIPLHPVQCQAMKLVWNCISNCPGVISTSQVEQLAAILTGMFGRYRSGELGMLSETFVLGCLTFAEALKSPSSHQIRGLETLVKETLNNAILSSLSAHKTANQLLLYSLYLMKEAILYSQQERFLTSCGTKEITDCIVEICEFRLLPWLGTILEEGEEEDTVMEVLEIFHLILLQDSEVKKTNFAETLASSSWISLSFGYLGLLPSNKMKCRLYLLLSSVVDCIFGQEFGDPIRNAYIHLPSDPVDLLFLLGQRSNCGDNLLSCQSAVISILYTSTLFEERIADDDQVLASLEQYILVNGSNFSLGIAGSTMLAQLVHLYSFTRGVLSAQGSPYSREAENTLFSLIADHDWDLLSIGIHPTALRWLFQQDSIGVPLSAQILNFCRSYHTNEGQLNKHGKIIRVLDIQTLSDLSISGDNYLASILVLLLQQLEGESQEDDLNLVMNVMLSILSIFPQASKQFCSNNIGDAFRALYYSHSPFLEVSTTTSLLVFNVLSSPPPEVLSEDRAWLPITVKLLERVVNPLLADDECSPEAHLMIGILCLVLHHSTNPAQALGEASKAILLNTALISAVDQKIQAACSKGPALVNHDEQTSFGESLLLVLLLYFFSLKSLQALLGEAVNWQDFIQVPPGGSTRSPPHVVNVSCGDLCRLLHFGSHPVKLVASQCLLELLTRISPQSFFSGGHLRSMAAVTEGLVFYEDPTVAMNCGLCSSIILQWEKKKKKNKNPAREFKWCRLIMEELTLLLVAPGLASRSFKAQHKSAAHIAKALLGSSDRAPEWMASLFNPPCVSGIIKSLSPSNLTAEMVELFRELAAAGFLDEDQAAALRQVLQACRKQMYRDSGMERRPEEPLLPMLIAGAGEAGKLCCTLLIRLMLSSCGQLAAAHTASERLLKAIDGFLQAPAGIP